jgi:hypothetical protein
MRLGKISIGCCPTMGYPLSSFLLLLSSLMTSLPVKKKLQKLHSTYPVKMRSLSVPSYIK